ncbi:CBM35 domain-containing protein [Archangium sp.]|uniref:CBM35 domain-containing protein n=1 Tax=Archangium sp. TaxID=1872627 RepID=UPI00389A0585
MLNNAMGEGGSLMISKTLKKASASWIAGICVSAVLAACTSDVAPGSDLQSELPNERAAPLLPPTVELDSPNDYQRQQHWLQFGNNNDAYWMKDGVWGAGALTEGTSPDQYEQNVGVYPPVGPNGEVAFRIKWRWPLGTTEVKGYPAVLSGRKPGYYSSNNLVDGQPVRLLDGTFSQTAPSGYTPGTFMPMQLPISALSAKFAHSDVTPPTGRGQLTFDLWLQSNPEQDDGFVNASITHEIMIPLDNWGNYGKYPDGRRQDFYDHDAIIDGRLFHVYCNKGSDGVLRYNFGWLNGHYGRSGWKFIVFQPDAPIPAGTLNLASFVNYLQTRRDSAGTPWAQGNEYLASVELGVEPVEGSGDLVVYDYKVSPTAPATSTRVQAETGVFSGSGVRVGTDPTGYEGSGFVGPFSDAGDRATVSFTNVTAGTYDILIRYHSWGSGRQQNDVIVNNGTTAWSAIFPGTGSGWALKTLSGVPLVAGTNTVAIVKDWGWIDVDSIEIVPGGSGETSTKKQMENGSLVGVKIEEGVAGYEGRGAVGPFANAGDRATVSFISATAGAYDIRIRYHAGGQQQNSVAINGRSRSELFPATGSGWGLKTLSGVPLAAGTNTVAIIKDWGWIDVDSIEIVPTGP